MEKIDITKILMALLVMTLLVTSGFAAMVVADSDDQEETDQDDVNEQETEEADETGDNENELDETDDNKRRTIGRGRNGDIDVESKLQKSLQKRLANIEGEIAIFPNPDFFESFSGNGFIKDSSEDSAQFVSIFARKNARAYPVIAERSGTDTGNFLPEVAELIAVSATDLEQPVDDSTDAVTAQALRATKNQGVWSGSLTIGTGQFHEQYTIIGKESEDGEEIKFAVISMDNYPVEIYELEIKRDIYPGIEIWEGDLEINSGNYEGEWDLTASSAKHFYGRASFPLEIAKGEEAPVGEYTIKTNPVGKRKLFWLIPFGKDRAKVQIFKHGELVAEQEIEEGETAELEDLEVTIANIEGDNVNIVTEQIKPEIEDEEEESEEDEE